MRVAADDVPLTWYFDLVSPFAYLALPRVLALAARHPVRLQPVVFGALLTHWRQLGPAEIGPKRLATYRLVQFQAAAAGMRFRFPPAHPFRSLDALRLLAALGGAPAAVRTAFEFIWAEGRDVAQPAECAALALRLGITDIAGLLDAQDAKETLRRETALAAARGVFGVPTLAVGEELFWGVDALPMAEAFLADPALFRRGEMARLQSLPTGVQRREAGASP